MKVSTKQIATGAAMAVTYGVLKSVLSRKKQYDLDVDVEHMSLKSCMASSLSAFTSLKDGDDYCAHTYTRMVKNADELVRLSAEERKNQVLAHLIAKRITIDARSLCDYCIYNKINKEHAFAAVMEISSLRKACMNIVHNIILESSF